VEKERYKSLIGMFLLVIGWALLFYFLKPTEIVNMIGIQSSYALVLLLGLFGALSSLTAFTIYPALLTLVAGGLNPLALILIGSMGLIVGDTVFFFIARGTRYVLPKQFVSRTEYFSKWLEKRNDTLLTAIIYIYVAFTPLPNNLLTGSLAMLNYPFKKLAWPLALGDITLPAMIVLLGSSGFLL